MPRVLVTGANGFAGAAVCRHLMQRGWTLRGSVRHSDAMVPQDVEQVVSGPLDGETDWRAALQDVEAVVHCAARVHVLRETAPDPLTAFRVVNVSASRRLAAQAAAAGVRRFVFLSSVGAAVAEAELNHATPYQRSKLEAEQALQEAVTGSAMVLVMLRPPLVYGPGAPGNFAQLARLVAAGWPLPLASLTNRRAQLFVGNLAGAVEAALACTTSPPAALPLCDGEDLSAAELARRIGRACGRPARLLPCPPALLRLAGRWLGRSAAVAALTRSLPVSNAEITAALGWEPSYSIDQGLDLTFSETAP